MKKTLYIIDGHFQIYRAYHALLETALTSPDGEPTFATYGFCKMLLKFIADKKPKYLAMATDVPTRELHRTKYFPKYKANRPPTPDELVVQIFRIKKIVEAMGIKVLEHAGFEADDLMATAAEQLGSDDVNVVLISRDKDLYQLVTENVTMLDPTDDTVITAETIETTKGYPPAKAVEVQTLMGDSTDNIPGIPGVGIKTAAKLIAKYGSAEAVLAHADEQTPKLKENLKAHGPDKLALSRRLVTLDKHVPVECTLDEFAFTAPGSPVRDIFAELDFHRLTSQLDSLGVESSEMGDVPSASSGDVATKPATLTGEAATEPQPLAIETTASDFEYTCIDTPEALDALVKELAKVTRLAVDTETTSINAMRASLVGISLAWKPGEAVYLPITAPFAQGVLDLDLVREKLGPILADERIEKIGHNLKYDLIVLENAGFTLAGPHFDTMIAAHVLNSTRRSFKMDDIAADILNHTCIPISDLIGRGKNRISMSAVPVDIVTPYAAEDADVTFRLAEVLRAQLETESLTELFADLEMPLMPVLARMERNGITVDPQTLKNMQVELSTQADAIRDRIIELVGHEFNVDSTKQLAEVLFGELAMKASKRGKTGPSTDSSVLEELAIDHEIPGLVLEYRKLTKLLSTYLTAMGQKINPDTHRVHTSFHQAGTVTGRLSSSDPNLQNIPIRSEEGRAIRSAFVAGEGCLLLSADYSQVELRVLAHFCQDPTLVAAFEAGQDVHRIVAAEVFSVAIEDVTPAQRAKAKTVNFGIVFGQTAFGLAKTLRIPRSEARDFIHDYHKRFPQINEFLQTCIAQAKAQGYVETVLGRRRRIPEIDSHNATRRSAAERLAISSVIQGSAADLIKRAMINIAVRIESENRPSKMLLQIHDELVFDIIAEHVETEKAMIVEEMISALEMRTPLKVDVGIGPNWMEAK